MVSTEVKTILIVDDKIENLEAIADSFIDSKLPYKIIKAPGGYKALELVKTRCPDIIIADWDMPEMDGIELIKQLEKNSCSADTPVIMCTGVMTTSKNLSTALDAGAIDYIRKPIDKIELFARVQSALILAESRKVIVEKNKELKELNATKDKFFSIMSHDLLGPFNSILGLSELLKDNVREYDIDKTEKCCSMLHDVSSNTFKLLENLLEWSRMQVGGINYSPTEFNLNDLINENIELLSEKARTKNITLSSPITDSIIVHADKYMIGTVIRNLTYNAIKFTPVGGLVSVDCHKTEDNVKLIVSDTGIGINKEKLDKLFYIEHSYSDKGTENEKGTGLGLLISMEFIKKHKSNIIVQSEVGKGSSFSFCLPVN